MDKFLGSYQEVTYVGDGHNPYIRFKNHDTRGWAFNLSDVEKVLSFPRVMLTGDSKSRMRKRVVQFMRNGLFYAWIGVETLEEAEKETVT